MLTGMQVRILDFLSHEVPVDDGSHEPVENPLRILEWSYPNLAQLIAGKSVLDFGCAFGDQSAAMTRKYACRVTGVDTEESYLAEAIRRYGAICEFSATVPRARRWDVVVSINAMEHYPEPKRILEEMLSAATPGGKVLITFGPPWWAPYGSHMHFIWRIPWLQLWFNEEAIMTSRSRHRQDGAMRFEECQEGLNKMSLRKFENLTRAYRPNVRYVAVKRLQCLAHIPVVREFFTNHVICEITV